MVPYRQDRSLSSSVASTQVAPVGIEQPITSCNREDAGGMVPLILMILGLVLVVVGVLALLAVVTISGVAWWLLLLVGAGLILLGWYLRTRPPSVV